MQLEVVGLRDLLRDSTFNTATTKKIAKLSVATGHSPIFAIQVSKIRLTNLNGSGLY